MSQMTPETIRKGAAVLQRMIDNAKAEAEAEIARLRAELARERERRKKLEEFHAAYEARVGREGEWKRVRSYYITRPSHWYETPEAEEHRKQYEATFVEQRDANDRFRAARKALLAAPERQEVTP